MSEPILSCENIEYCEGDSCLFKDVSFQLNRGQRAVVLAEPHRYATTLLKICATLTAPTGGQIRLFGRTLEEMDKQDIYEVRRRIGLVRRETSLVSNVTILDNVSLGLQYHEEIDREEAHEQVADLLRQFELYEDRFLRPAQLTFEQRRLAVYARELAKKPQLILLEHPSLDLGERVYGLLLEIFKTCSIEDGCAFLVSSIKPEVVKHWGEWVLIFDKGRCEHLEGDQFDHAGYRTSMRGRGAQLSREWRDQ
ncbi:MAG: ATP-binding cassette domain-containing protein [Deltaproteobacteria bacterium]|nr:MAG: ATP-binding cassette domain-containing protein [Deltaproteobacteria bacterium]